MDTRVLVGVMLVAFFAPSLVLGWGQIGHAAIANTAWELMDKAAKAKAETYLPSGVTMTSIASLADQYAETPAGNWSAHLHFVNMNRGQTYFEMSVDCVNGCVVEAILNNTALLVDDKFLASLVNEPNPFEFLVHFVGDVHQPLHVGWGYDKGGNEVECYFFGEKTELHAVWDTGIIENYNSNYYDWSEQLLDIVKSNNSLLNFYTATMVPSNWADESFDYVRNDVYNFYPDGKVSTVGETPSLGDDYYKFALPIVTERLLAAAIRLAALLDKIFG